MRNGVRGIPLAVALVVCLLLVAAQSATAGQRTFALLWSGEPYGNGLTANGILTFDDQYWPDGTQVAPTSFPLPAFGISDFSLEVVRGPGLSDVYVLGDFSAFNFTFPGLGPTRIDFSHELIGQPIQSNVYVGQPPGSRFGLCDLFCGDFNVFGASSQAPTGTNYFTLTTMAGEDLRLVSMVPVPEVSMISMLVLGLLTLAGSMATSMGERRGQGTTSS